MNVAKEEFDWDFAARSERADKKLGVVLARNGIEASKKVGVFVGLMRGIYRFVLNSREKENPSIGQSHFDKLERTKNQQGRL